VAEEVGSNPVEVEESVVEGVVDPHVGAEAEQLTWIWPFPFPCLEVLGRQRAPEVAKNPVPQPSSPCHGRELLLLRLLGLPLASRISERVENVLFFYLQSP